MGITQIIDFSRKHFGSKQHKEPCKVKGTTQNIDFEQHIGAQQHWEP